MQSVTSPPEKKEQTLSAPSISLPKGGGAIRGIGEKFSANPVTGTGSLSVPIATSPGRAGFGPQLSLSYDSGAGNGPFGLGWSISLPSITRKTEKGLPLYIDDAESDVFILSGSEDLVPELRPDGSRFEDVVTVPGFKIQRYRPRIEGLFARIERWTRIADGDVHWRSISKDNVLTIYGKDSESRISDPNGPLRVFSWLISETRDDKGNAVVYRYKPEDGTALDLTSASERNRGDRGSPQRRTNRYLKRILYGNRVPLLDGSGHRPRDVTTADLDGAIWMFEVVFDYGEHNVEQPKPKDAGTWQPRKDPFSSYRSGCEIRTYRLCRRVLMFHHFPGEPGVGNDCLVRSTSFTYRETPIASFISSVSQSGYKRDQAGGYLKRSIPPLEFEYTEAVVGQEIQNIDAQSLRNLPYGVDGTVYRWVDLDSEGLQGILTEQGGSWFYKANESALAHDPVSPKSAQFAPSRQVQLAPSGTPLRNKWRFADLAGDGRVDLASYDPPVTGFYERTDERTWERFRSFESIPNLDWNDPNLRFIDLTGDGLPDLLVTENEALTWYPSLGKEGFGSYSRVATPADIEKGPRLVFADGTQTVFIADFSGDGLTDIVRIRNGEVAYWPNLGYGRFGPKVTMDNAPRFDEQDQFDPGRIRLADIDGSGVADLIYLGRLRTQFWFNQSGNSWSEAKTLDGFPPVDNVSNISSVDLLGNGTTCLVWSSPLPSHAGLPMHYINLMADGKPHLLTKIRNNLGAETVVVYRPSTYFYLLDKQSGKPWITKLPFPVHVVERVETFDYISRNRFVTRYAYHHGYFDAAEREFRGFGLVEQWDTGEIGATASDATRDEATNFEDASFVPPVLARTWFHTGAFFVEGLSKQFTTEYYSEVESGLNRERSHDNQSSAMLLPDTVLPDGLSAAEVIEASRSLKGAILRQEVYALDRRIDGTLTEESDRPFSVSEHNYTIRLVQPKRNNTHAVFLVHPRETINLHYERKLYDFAMDGRIRKQSDPRVVHALNLEVDDYGNVLKSVAIGYGRRYADHSLSQSDQSNQNRTLLTYSENRYTNDVLMADAFRAPLPCEVTMYELLKVEPTTTGSGIVSRLSFDQLSDLSNKAEFFQGKWDIPSHDIDHKSAVDDHPYRRLIKHVRTLYRSDQLDRILPLGHVDLLALAGETYKLAHTTTLLTTIYRRESADGTGEDLLPNPMATLCSKSPDGGGYVDLEGDGCSWIPSGRVFYAHDPADDHVAELEFARRHFFLPHRFSDAFGKDTVVAYDSSEIDSKTSHNLLLVKTVDPLGNIVLAQNDYRALQSTKVIDPNGTTSETLFDAMGLAVATAVHKEEIGDSLIGAPADLTQDQLQEFFADPEAKAPMLLGRATTRVVYDMDCYSKLADPDSPPYVATLARETHLSDQSPEGGSRVQIKFSYWDGVGREIQKKIQVEPGPVNALHDKSRWVGSGWKVFDNKGNPVKQYEPFFDNSHKFKSENKVGASSVSFYDPVGRIVASLHPDDTYEKAVFDPWHQTTYDTNDNVTEDPRSDQATSVYVAKYFESQPPTWRTWYMQRLDGSRGADERVAAQRAQVHANTPSEAYFDSLGRTFVTVANNGKDKNGNVLLYSTHLSLDIEGNENEVIDSSGRIVMRYRYDLLGNRIFYASMEGGRKWVLNNVFGKPIRIWDDRGFNRRMTYDELQRPLELFVTSHGAREAIFKKTVYGESKPHAETTNHRLKSWKTYDGGGVIVKNRYDLNGNLVLSTRQLVSGLKAQPDWSQDPQLESEVFTSQALYDALNRLTQIVVPHSDRGAAKFNVVQFTYNKSNLIEHVEVWLEQETEPRGLLDSNTATMIAVRRIDYNAKGQRELVRYGNDVDTTYEYDSHSFRLIGLKTSRGGNRLQDLSYAYDPVGNISSIHDAAQQTIYFSGQIVTPSVDYTYDPVYRLIRANGREHIGQISQPETTWDDEPRVGLAHPNDGQKMRNYSESYVYDEVGNILRFVHNANSGNWVRTYAYDEPSTIESQKKSNRLSSTTVRQVSGNYLYDAHGNAIRIPNLGRNGGPDEPNLYWNFEDRLQMVNLGGGGTAYYGYDAAGERVRKVHEHVGGLVEDRISLGNYEVYRKSAGNKLLLERETVHVSDGKLRIVLVETRTFDENNADDTPRRLLRYQLGNHLGSSILELDEKAQIMSYEEYYPFGGTSFQAVSSDIKMSPKRFRYMGKERDEETGLYYFGLRYCAPWLGRWVSFDPLDIKDGPNGYSFVHNRPTVEIDPIGADGQPSSPQRQPWWRFTEAGAYYQTGKHDVFQPNPGVDTGFAPLNLLANTFVTVANICTMPFNAVTEVAALPEEAMRAAGASEMDIEAMNFSLMMVGVGEVNMVSKSAAIAREAEGIGVAVTDARQAAVTATKVEQVAMDVKQATVAAPKVEEVGVAVADVRQGSSTAKKVQQAVATASETKQAATLVGTNTRQFSRDAAKLIRATDNHPLSFLLDKSGKFKSTKGLSHAELANRPDLVQMGHIISRKSGQMEKIMLQGAWENQFNAVTAEKAGTGVYVENVAIDIGGVAVDLKTASFWEKNGLIPQGSVASARRIDF